MKLKSLTVYFLNFGRLCSGDLISAGPLNSLSVDDPVVVSSSSSDVLVVVEVVPDDEECSKVEFGSNLVESLLSGMKKRFKLF